MDLTERETEPCKKEKHEGLKLPSQLTPPPLPPQYVCMRRVLRPSSGDPHQEGHRPPHPRQDETQAQQDLRRLPGSEEVSVRGRRASRSCPTPLPAVTLTTVQSASQWDLGVHGRDGQRHRYPRRQLGAAVRSPQQRQVSRRDEVSPSLCVFFLKGLLCPFIAFPDHFFQTSVYQWNQGVGMQIIH